MKRLLLFLFLITVWTAHGEELGFENGVLCLYKTPDERDRLELQVLPVLKGLGLRPVLRSMAFPPETAELRGNRAVLTWFADGLYPYPEKYLDFLAATLEMGKKVVIIGGLGAYGRKDGDKVVYLGNDSYNKVLLRMGLSFLGYWTDNADFLETVYSDKSIAEKNAPQSPQESKHYYKIEITDPGNIAHLVIRRTDYKDEGLSSGDSPVIVTGPSGGFCLESYDSRPIDGKPTLMIDLGRFIESSLFHDDGVQRFLVVHDAQNTGALYPSYLSNIARALELSKLEYDSTDVQQLSFVTRSDLNRYEAVVLGVTDYSLLPESVFFGYVGYGGRLVGLGTANPGGLSPLFGLKNFAMVSGRSKTILGTGQFLLGRENFPRFDGLDLQARDVVIENTARVIWELEQGDACIPMLWEYEYGEGKTVFWNSDLIGSDRNTRSLVSESVLRVSDVSASGLANIGLIWMDDCPAPLWNTNNKQSNIDRIEDLIPGASEDERIRLGTLIDRLKKNYPDELDSDFMEKTWFPDIRRIVKQYDIRMSFFLVFNYESEVTPPFLADDFYIARNNLSAEMGSRIIADGHELGLHGFNHEPLTLYRASPGDDFKPWNKENMLDALLAAKKEWSELYGNHTLPQSYVAPANVIAGEGIEALRNAFPSITTIGTMYHKGAYETDMDFGFVSSNPNVFSMPRSSSGYGLIGTERFNLLVTLDHFGVLSHFIHPDDYADEERSFGYMGWKYMKEEFEQLLQTVKYNYPWLEFFQVRDARDIMTRYLSKGVRVREFDDRMEIETSQGASERPYFFRVRFNEKSFRSVKDCEVVFAYPENRDIVFKTKSPKSTIYLSD